MPARRMRRCRPVYLVDQLAHTGRLTERHPGEKALFALGLLGLAVTLPPVPGQATVLAAALAGLAVSGHRLRDLLKVLALPVGFLLSGTVALVVTVDPLGPGPLLGLSAAGAETAVATTLRAAAALACLTFLIVTTPLADLVWLMRRAGLPAALVEVMQLTYRFVLLTADMAAAGVTAQQARLGWQGVARSWRSAGMLGAALLPRVLDRAARLERGLAARGPLGSLTVLTPAWELSPAAIGAILVGEGLIAGVSLWLL
jgi:cobalt/nickel transport system permease protein